MRVGVLMVPLVVDCLQVVLHHLRHGAQPARLRGGCVDICLHVQ